MRCLLVPGGKEHGQSAERSRQVSARASESFANEANGAAVTLHASPLRYWLDKRSWRRCKRGIVRAMPRLVANGIVVARAQPPSMLANTCCTTLLLQGAPVSPP